jgi:hypothetical protein
LQVRHFSHPHETDAVACHDFGDLIGFSHTHRRSKLCYVGDVLGLPAFMQMLRLVSWPPDSPLVGSNSLSIYNS